MESSFPPIRSSYSPQIYRVIIAHIGMDYIIHTGDNMFRIMTEDKLPPDISSKLAMIKAYEQNIELPRVQTVTAHAPYINNFPDEFSDIGWCVGTFPPNSSSKLYCILVDLSLLLKLRGEVKET